MSKRSKQKLNFKRKLSALYVKIYTFKYYQYTKLLATLKENNNIKSK